MSFLPDVKDRDIRFSTPRNTGRQSSIRKNRESNRKNSKEELFPATMVCPEIALVVAKLRSSHNGRGQVAIAIIGKFAVAKAAHRAL